MAIIELAYCSLKNGLTATDAEVKRSLREVKSVIEAYNHLPTVFYTQLDDPSKVFVIGAWESKEQHEHGFVGSPEQKQIIDLTRSQMDIDWMHYMDVQQSHIPLHAPVLVIAKVIAPPGTHKTIFDQDFAAGTPSLGGARHGAVWAWNIPKKHEHDMVRVHFTGWDSVEEAMEGITNTIEHTKKFRSRPEDLNFFFVERTPLAEEDG
jgi:hypothetical protein